MGDCGMRGVGGVCEMCMCFPQGEWMRGLGLYFTNPVGTGGVLDMSLCFGCGGEWVGAWTRVWSGGLVLCL